MSLLMQALRKAERARAHNGEGNEAEHQFGQDAVPSPPPIEGGPAFAVMPDSWRLEPLDAEPPVVAAEEAAHDPVPPQARHEPTRAATSRATAAPGNDARTSSATLSANPATDAATAPAGVRNPGARPAPPRTVASAQRRLLILAGTLAAMLVTFALIYWRAISGPGPGARMPMVPMPAPGDMAAAQHAAQQAAAMPVTPYDVLPNGEPTTGLPAAASPIATASVPAAPPSSPRTAVTIPTPEQLAAITDPAIRAEAMRDANERAARQVRMEGPPSPSGMVAGAEAAPEPASQPATVAEPAERTVNPQRQQRHQAAGQALASTAAKAGASAASTPATASSRKPAPPTAVGESGDVRFVRSAGSLQVAPAVQNGYAALQTGDLATARQHYDQALLQDPNNRDALLGSAAVALREHDGRQASANYLRLLELDPNDPEALAGLTELRPGDLQTSETKLRGLAREHPESGPVQFALGNLYAQQGRWPEAQQSYFRAFTALPGNADYAFNLGVGLDRMNQPRLAQTYYRRALELAQASPPGFNVDAARKRLQALETPAQ